MVSGCSCYCALLQTLKDSSGYYCNVMGRQISLLTCPLLQSNSFHFCFLHCFCICTGTSMVIDKLLLLLLLYCSFILIFIWLKPDGFVQHSKVESNIIKVANINFTDFCVFSCSDLGVIIWIQTSVEEISCKGINFLRVVSVSWVPFFLPRLLKGVTLGQFNFLNSPDQVFLFLQTSVLEDCSRGLFQTYVHTRRLFSLPSVRFWKVYPRLFDNINHAAFPFH